MAWAGENTLEFDWPLDDNSVVYEVGGFNGRWSTGIIDRYGCIVHAYEPMHEKVQILQDLHITKYPSLIVHGYGLGTSDQKHVPLGSYGNDAASFMLADADGCSVEGELGYGDIVDAAKVITVPIDLMEVNCEGFEFELLPYFKEANLLRYIKRMMVQFHMRFDSEWVKYHEIDAMLLANGYKQLWNYAPTFVAWEREQ